LLGTCGGYVFFGPSSCVSVGVAGVRGGQATQCVWVCGICLVVV
jgi:hypothetical protein